MEQGGHIVGTIGSLYALIVIISNKNQNKI